MECMATEVRLTPAQSEIYLDALLDEDLGALRVEFSRTVSQQIGAIAGWLAVDSWLGAGDIAEVHDDATDRPDPIRYAAFRAVSTVVQMAAELSAGVITLLDCQQRYAAAALIRQLIETEYLLSAFDADFSRATVWHQSTPADIRRTFRPATIRRWGGFSDREYWVHCETGGHPSPQGAYLLRHGSKQDDEVVISTMWGDLAKHLRRVWTAVHSLLATHHARFTRVRSQEIAVVGDIEARWFDADPLAYPNSLNVLRALMTISEGAEEKTDNRSAD